MSEKPGSRPSAVQGRRDAAVVSMSQSLHTSGSMRGSWIALRIAPSTLMPVRFLWSYARCIGHPPATRCFSAYGKLAGAWAMLAKQRSRLRSPRWRSAAGSRKPRPEASIRRRAPAVLVRSCSPTLVPMVVTWTQRSPTCAGGQTLPNAKKTRYSRRVRTVLKVSTVMHKRNENLTKAYSVRVRSGSISGKNRTRGECTDNYYQAVAERSRVLAPPLPASCVQLHPSHSPLVAPFAMSQIAPFNLAGRALSTGDTTSRVTNQAGVTTTASAAGMQRAHPVHQVHHSTASRSPHAGKTVRDHAWTVRDGGRSKVETPPRPDRAPSLFFAPSKLDFENEDHE